MIQRDSVDHGSPQTDLRSEMVGNHGDIEACCVRDGAQADAVKAMTGKS